MVKKEELIKWFKENYERIDGGYIAAYKNKYTMNNFIDGQYMDLEFRPIHADDDGIGFLASQGFPASYYLDSNDILHATEIEEYDGCKCYCKYLMLIKLKHKRIMRMYFNLKEDN